ncbi:hypothetical protein ACE193_09360 [Bernardetia sp. OM2101]|uniref:hypothetical protein n=1 Tax=Bernardetia sp. OM2101 TaxID=3344876 RepID=UPI0035CF2527
MDKNIEGVLQKYPSLSLVEEGIIEGFLEVGNEDKYFIKIDITNFPTSFPRVWETNERIPRKVDRHINKDDTLCFTTQVYIEILLATQVKSLVDFAEIILIPYLQNNSYFEINKEYKFGEFSHNYISAIIDSLKEILNIERIDVITRLVFLASKNFKIRPNDKCFCGSNLKIKICKNHLKGFKDLRKISKSTLQEYFKFLKKLAIHNQKL